MRVLLHTGKGGVGKTSLAVATALGAARHGHRVCLLSTDAAHSLGDALGRPVGPRPLEVAPGVVAQEISALVELDRSWEAIHGWLAALLHDGSNEMVSEELLILPGMEEIVALRAVRALVAGGEFDVCVLDCAPTSSTLRLLRIPDVLRWFMEHLFELERSTARLVRPLARSLGAARFVAPEEVFEAVESLYAELEGVQEMLQDADQTSARLVVNPARVIVAETRRTFSYLSLYGVATDAVLVNRVLPAEAARGYFAHWAKREAELLEEIAASFPVPRLHAQLRPREPIGLEALGALAEELYAGEDPARHFVRASPLRLSREAGRTRLEIDLPGSDAGDVDVSVYGEDLLVRVRDVHRRISLPTSIAGRSIDAATLREGTLEIVFTS